MTLCWILPYEDLMLNANIIFSFHDLISTCSYVKMILSWEFLRHLFLLLPRCKVRGLWIYVTYLCSHQCSGKREGWCDMALCQGISDWIWLLSLVLGKHYRNFPDPGFRPYFLWNGPTTTRGQILPDSFNSTGQGRSDCIFRVQNHKCPLPAGWFTKE